jgi:broad specificity phosphatase PhoE
VPRQILLMRHAEKPDDDTDPGLSPAGKQRASRLATYIPQSFGSIGFLFASAPSKHSIRPIATMTPLSEAIDVPIGENIADQDYPVLAREVLTDPKYAAATVLICWHHGHLPDFAEALGASPSQVGGRWDPLVFNLIWRLDYPPGSTTPTLTPITEPF